MQFLFQNVLPFPLSIGQTIGDRVRAPNRDFSLTLRIHFGARMIQTKSAKYEIIINHAANSATSPTDAGFIIPSIYWRMDTVPNTKISLYFTFLYLSVSSSIHLPPHLHLHPVLHIPPYLHLPRHLHLLHHLPPYSSEGKFCFQIHCNENSIYSMYSFSGNSAASAPISIFMCL
jgi:hypothetical protein